MLRAISIIPQNSPKGKAIPRKIPPASFRKTRGDASALAPSSLMALKCIIMQMWILILNLRRGCWIFIFFFFFPKKGVPYVVIIASLFCNVNCNYAFCKGGWGAGEGRKGTEVALHPCSMVSVSMVCPPCWQGRGVRSGKVRTVRYTGPCEPWPSTSWGWGWGRHTYQLVWSRISILAVQC